MSRPCLRERLDLSGGATPPQGPTEEQGADGAEAAHVRTVFTVRKDSINKTLRIREKRTTRCQKRGPGRERIWLEDGYIAIMKPRPRCSSSRRDDRALEWGASRGPLLPEPGVGSRAAFPLQVRVLSGRAGRTTPPPAPSSLEEPC
ncbi:unnamed protein product [Boreogadus saida]